MNSKNGQYYTADPTDLSFQPFVPPPPASAYDPTSFVQEKTTAPSVSSLSVAVSSTATTATTKSGTSSKKIISIKLHTPRVAESTPSDSTPAKDVPSETPPPPPTQSKTIVYNVYPNEIQ